MREQITLRLPTELLEATRQQAQQKGDSVNEMIVRFIRQGLGWEFPHSGLQKPVQPPA